MIDIEKPAPVEQPRLVRPWVGKLRHDREEFADWGWIKDETNAIIFEAKIPCGPHSDEADDHRLHKTDPAQARVDVLLKAFEIVERLAEWSRKYPRQQTHSFSAKVDEQLIAIEEEAKALFGEPNAEVWDGDAQAGTREKTSSPFPAPSCSPLPESPEN